MASVAGRSLNLDWAMMNRDRIIEDLRVKMKYYQPASKDICIVVHNGLDHVAECLESIRTSTDSREPYVVWVWDNASDKPTRDYLMQKSLAGEIEYFRSHQNVGFIDPSNALASLGEAPYTVLLNSDTVVSPGWDEALISYLQYDPDIAQVGYQGALLNDVGMGFRAAHGYDVDYINGWCFAVRRNDYHPAPLFDSENLSFAYGEDSDLSLRLKEKGKKIYALHLDLVQHLGNKTVQEVAKYEGWHEKMRATFRSNHEYIRGRWADYLANHRFGLQASSTEL